MNIKQFLAEFKHIVLVPDGIKYLREMILSLAFQGNLTQHVNEDASSLLISLKKQRVHASKASYGYQKQTHAGKSEPAFTIPEHWKWSWLGDIRHDWGQKIPSTDFTYIDVSSIDNKKGLLKEQLTIVKSGQKVPSRARKIVRNGTVIYSSVRPYLLNIALVDREFEHEAIASTAFVVIRTWEGILPKYVYYYLRCPYFIAYVQSVQSGVAYPAISDKKFFSGRIPIPPTAEQQRIVAKVDELMALCDKLEAQQQERIELSKLTRCTALDSLKNASPIALRSAWERVENSLSILFGEPDSALELATTIKDLALRGALTERGPGSAAELLAAAHREQLELIKQKRIPKIKGLLSVTEVPYDLPANWRWSRLHQVAEVIDPNPSHRMPNYVPHGVPFISTESLSDNDQIDFLVGKQVSAEVLAEHIRRYEIRDGSFAFSRIGTIGKTCHLPKQRTYCISHVLVVISSLTQEIDERYLRLAVSAESTIKQAREGIKSIGVPDLGMSKIRHFLIPIPPKEEQIRIVAKVDRLIRICSTLEASIGASQSLANDLAFSAISSITGIQIKEQEKMKIPKTELVSTLRIGVSPANSERAPLAAILIRTNGEMPAKTLWQASAFQEIDAFYQQLKTEMARGWIVQPQVAYMKEVEVS